MAKNQNYLQLHASKKITICILFSNACSLHWLVWMGTCPIWVNILNKSLLSSYPSNFWLIFTCDFTVPSHFTGTGNNHWYHMHQLDTFFDLNRYIKNILMQSSYPVKEIPLSPFIKVPDPWSISTKKKSAT